MSRLGFLSTRPNSHSNHSRLDDERMDAIIVDTPLPPANGLAFATGQPQAQLNFPSSSTSVPTHLPPAEAPAPAAAPASPERSTRSAAAAQQRAAQAQAQERDDSPAERRQRKEERDQLRQVKAERRARRGDYQDSDKQERLMTSLLEMLGEFFALRAGRLALLLSSEWRGINSTRTAGRRKISATFRAITLPHSRSR